MCSIPVPSSIYKGAPVAQLVKHWPTDLAVPSLRFFYIKQFQSVGWLF